MNQQTQRLTLSLTPAAVEALRDLAEQKGYIAPSGRHAGVGSISAFLGALARGDLIVFRQGSSAFDELQDLVGSGPTVVGAVALAEQLRATLVCLAENEKRPEAVPVT